MSALLNTHAVIWYLMESDQLLKRLFSLSKMQLSRVPAYISRQSP